MAGLVVAMLSIAVGSYFAGKYGERNRARAEAQAEFDDLFAQAEGDAERMIGIQALDDLVDNYDDVVIAMVVTVRVDEAETQHRVRCQVARHASVDPEVGIGAAASMEAAFSNFIDSVERGALDQPN